MNPFKAVGKLFNFLKPHKNGVVKAAWEVPAFDPNKAAVPIEAPPDKIVTDGVRARMQTMEMKLNKTFTDAAASHKAEEASQSRARQAVTGMFKKEKRSTPPSGIMVHKPS